MNNNQIIIELSREDFLTLIKDAIRRRSIMDALDKVDDQFRLGITDVFIDLVYDAEPLYAIMNYNVMYETMCEGDMFWDMIANGDDAETICDLYYPYFDFVNKDISRLTPLAKAREQELFDEIKAQIHQEEE